MPPPVRHDPVNLICAIASMVVGGLLGAYFSFKLIAGTPLPLPLVLALIAAGTLNVLLGIGIIQRRRAAWAFSLAMHIVAALVTVIGAPAAARAGLNPIGAAIPPLYAVAMVVLLAMSDHEW